MRFGEALDDVFKWGATMRRSCWHDDAIVGYRLPDGRSDLTTGYFYVECDDITAPYIPNAFELTAHDWVVLNESD